MTRREPRKRGESQFLEPDVKPQHMKDGPAGGSLRSNNFSVSRQNPKQVFDEDSDQISHIDPSYSSGESQRAYRRRQNDNDYAYNQRKRSRKNKFLLGIAIAIFAVIISVVAGYSVWVATLDENLSKGMSEDVTALLKKAPLDSEVTYTLIVGTTPQASAVEEKVCSIVIMRIDPSIPSITFISVPTDYRVYLSDATGYQRLSEIFTTESPAVFLKEISRQLDITFNNYFQMDVEAFEPVVNGLKPIQMEVPSSVTYNGLYTAEGLHDISGQDFYVLFNCRKAFKDGDFTRMMHQRYLIEQLLRTVAESGTLDIFPVLEEFTNAVTTNLTYENLSDILEMIDKPTSLIQGTVVSTKNRTTDDITYQILDNEVWPGLFSSIKNGLVIVAPDIDIRDASIIPSDYTVTVRNGSGIAGCANQAADILSAEGYIVEEVGNANSFVYDETLVIYNYDEHAAIANDIIDRLGQGRTVENFGAYQFETTILVVIGKNWMPK